ncbi:MAG TPA: hypothetical protein VGR79_03475 [Stellaceae bacterium]|nr:hypothetical protein [Stellaceae bacterium]
MVIAVPKRRETSGKAAGNARDYGTAPRARPGHAAASAQRAMIDDASCCTSAMTRGGECNSRRKHLKLRSSARTTIVADSVKLRLRSSHKFLCFCA